MVKVTHHQDPDLSRIAQLDVAAFVYNFSAFIKLARFTYKVMVANVIILIYGHVVTFYVNGVVFATIS